ncbi:MAG TPA: PQQ-binding-like beta-propeller repeat protein [Ktedonobacterales bacterium]|nr:PQQ-binding-like beta-propeller repeat protein [Ktedonobacterales bacterium]
MFGNGKVFVSHSHDDNAACAPVLVALDAWLVDYWFDTAQLSAGLELFDNIHRALQDRDIFLRICSPAALVSQWMAQEQKLARTLKSPNGRRRMINLIVKPGYVASPEEANDIVIHAIGVPQVVWLRQLRQAMEVPLRERRVSRRAVFGVGITSLAALGGMGYAGKLLLSRPGAPKYLPVGHQPTPTALPGASRVRWTYTIPDIPLNVPTSLSLAGKTLVCSSGGGLTAVSAADGTTLWTQSYDGINGDVPLMVVGDTMYSTYVEVTEGSSGPNSFLNNTYLTALKVSDGSERWHTLVFSDPNDTNVRSAVAAAGNVACVRYNQSVYAFDTTTGKSLWHQSAGGPPTQLDELLPAPTIDGSSVYAVLGDGKLHTFSLTTGTPIWPAPFGVDLPIRTQPVVAGGVVYVGVDGGWCYALDAATGQVRWKTPLLKETTPRFTSLGLTLSGNVLYISGGFPLDTVQTDALHGPAVQALNPATGKILWPSAPSEQIKLNGLESDLIHANSLVTDNAVFVAVRLSARTGKNVNILFALNKATGKVRWTFQMWGGEEIGRAGAYPSTPVVSGDMLYIVSGDGVLYAISYAN